MQDSLTGVESGERGDVRLMVAVFAALMVALRLLWIQYPEPWYDELFTMGASKTAYFFEVLRKEAAYNPHGYYLLTRTLTAVAPDLGVAGYRLLSALFSCLTLWPLLLLGRRYLTPLATVILLALWAVNPSQLFFAQEARGYSLVGFLVCCNMYFIAEYSRQPSRRSWWGFVVSACLALFTHYTTIFYLPSTVAFPLFMARDVASRRRILMGYVGAALVIGLVFMPYFYWFNMASGESGGIAWLTPPESYLKEALRSPFKVVFDYPARLWSKHFEDVAAPGGNRPLVNLTIGGLLLAFLITVLLSRRAPAMLRASVLSYGITILFLVVVSKVYAPCFLAGRYEILSQPLLLMTMAYGVGWLWERRRLLGLAVAVGLLGIYGFKLAVYYQEGWRHEERQQADLAQFLGKSSGTALVLSPVSLRLAYMLESRGFSRVCGERWCTMASPDGALRLKLADMPMGKGTSNFKFEPPFSLSAAEAEHNATTALLLAADRPAVLWVEPAMLPGLEGLIRAAGYCVPTSVGGESGELKALALSRLVPCQGSGG